ncbi:LSU ribosomal protein L21P [Brevibacterium aurantiacum]|uniref:Large ribosomal subunit protein bL21 n=4 Tax=Brevibacterium TaxID=1696 RepID=A0A2H1JQ61_BREAU|nr:LSU ribosomal protein L21p [Brevibacterium aurantiacum]SMX70059.1 LSU ribosomal protein L21P [Brevibacterium aurantiacum]SMX73299.1 LSU ribosomal protein L21P [Brevibacterium aurantiacum]SMX82037.1 LSU ribosomal protein L21P [Brevibacterium aurantiacum]SMX89593.1 LSU ribosomal protein L21P [Brevibacterium aurantiacum]
MGHPGKSFFGSQGINRRSFVYEQKGFDMVYAIVRAGGHQEKVSVGDIITVNRMKAKAGESVELDAVLLVDGETVTTDVDALSKVAVSAEVVNELRGPKIIIQKYKNKTGYKKRQGHRQDLTRLKITNIK